MLSNVEGFSPREALVIEVPDVAMAEGVGVGVAGEDVSGDIPGQRPAAAFPAALDDRQVDRGEVATVVAAGADQQGYEVPCPDRDLVDGIDLRRLAAVHDASGQLPALASPAQLQRPGEAVAAFGMGVDDSRLDPRQAGHRAPPADGDVPGRRGMDGHAPRLHDPGDADLAVRRVGDDARRLGAAPAFDERVSAVTLQTLLEVGFHLDRRVGTDDPQIVQPGRQHLRIQPAVAAELAGVELALVAPGLVRRGEVPRGILERLAFGLEVSQGGLKVAEHDGRTTRGLEPRLLPYHMIMFAAVAGVPGDERDDDVLGARRGAQLDAERL